MSKSILIVDDDEEILYCYRMLLENEEVDVYSAINAEDALEILRDVEVDVAILDYMLPTCRGDRLAQMIGETYPEVAVYIISGFYSVEEALAGLGVQVRDVLKKPVDPDTLEDMIMAECQIADY